jgi:poly-gamma-glutamate capsule biosynthesis protein CapA/YwtB (metallophosphatase superfamily)
MVPVLSVSSLFGVKVMWDSNNQSVHIITSESEQLTNVEPEVKSITISSAGDVTLGGDDSYGFHGSFNQEAKNSGIAFFVENIKDLFSQDDLTIVNLETTLTKATSKAQKQFAFKGDPSYTEILTLGSIEAVNLANNHTFDYLEKGYQDTIENLKNVGIGYFGYENHNITEIQGIKIGMLGYKGWHDNQLIRDQIKKDIQNLKEQNVKVVIVNFHWGEERHYVPNKTQTSLGRFTVDSGADLVIGHHPHVVQGIEEYNGKFIVYSLGNFMFGGNRNPSDKDTFVFQQTFHIEDGELTDKKEIKVIPFRISSVNHRNNYQPTPLRGKAAKTLKEKIINLSKKISSTNWVEYEG